MESIKDTVEALSQSLSARMTTFEEELKKMAPCGSITVSNLAQEFMQFQLFAMSAIQNLQSQTNLLMMECDETETRSRRNMLLFHGIPEAKNEKSVQVAVNIGIKLDMPELKSDDIQRAHRLGRASTTKPRPLVVKFCSQELRDRVWFAKTALKGSGVTLSEFLTRRRHNLFMEARTKLGVTKCWTSQGRVVVLGGGGKRHSINSSAELEKVLPVEANRAHQEHISGTSTSSGSVVALAARRKRVPTTKK